ncbi:MAG: Gfo/Idh/MocA family oxidoreductase [Burkholderiaceae bacterium]
MTTSASASSARRFRWGVFGTGAVSAKFVAGLVAAQGAEASFVASRTLAKARRFSAALGIPRAIEGYAEAAASGGVDAIYVATPPSEHAAHAKLCIDAGIPVLVEKPFAVTAAQATDIAATARAKSVFAMEAMWTRFLPAARAMKERLAERSVGDVRLVSGSFGTSQVPDAANGMFDPSLAGGAVAHLAPYPLSLAQWLFGSPTLTHALGSIGSTGVIEEAAFQLLYPNGVVGSFFTSIRAWAADDFNVMGTDGMIAFDGSIVRPNGLRVSRQAPIHAEETDLRWRARVRQSAIVHRVAQATGRSSRSRSVRLRFPYAGNGYHYEADEVRNCVLAGNQESATMPLSDSIAVAATADRINEAIMASAGRARSRAA